MHFRAVLSYQHPQFSRRSARLSTLLAARDEALVPDILLAGVFQLTGRDRPY